jgi:hypothetical protein
LTTQEKTKAVTPAWYQKQTETDEKVAESAAGSVTEKKAVIVPHTPAESETKTSDREDVTASNNENQTAGHGSTEDAPASDHDSLDSADNVLSSFCSGQFNEEANANTQAGAQPNKQLNGNTDILTLSASNGEPSENAAVPVGVNEQSDKDNVNVFSTEPETPERGVDKDRDSWVD